MNDINILTQREKDTLTLIAKALNISVHTVKAHIESIYRKLGVHNKVQAAVFAILHDEINY